MVSITDRQRAGVNMSPTLRKTPRDKRREQLRRRQCLPLAFSSLATVITVIGSLVVHAEAFVGLQAQVARLSAHSHGGIHDASKGSSFRRRLPPPARLPNSRSTRWAKLAVWKRRSVRGFDVSKKFDIFLGQRLLHMRHASNVSSYAPCVALLRPSFTIIVFPARTSVMQVRTTKCNFRDRQVRGAKYHGSCTTRRMCCWQLVPPNLRLYS